MQNYNQQQTAVILKGIAQQVLSMNMPSINELMKLYEQFDLSLTTLDYRTEMEVKADNWNKHGEEFYRLRDNYDNQTDPLNGMTPIDYGND